MFPGRNHLLRMVQAVFRRQSLSRLSASLRQPSRHRSTSASRVDQPILSRTAPWAISASNPIASSTWDGCTLPDEQAEPEDTAIPARSKPITAVSALRPGAVNKVVLGNRRTDIREYDDFGCLSQAVLQPFPQGLQTRSPSPGRAAIAAVSRGAKAGDARPHSRFRHGGSVPGPPPRKSGSSPLNPSDRTSAPTPLGPPILCADSVRRSAPNSVISSGIFPNAWIASTCSSPSAA